MEPIQEKIRSGTPYIGWSAGSNEFIEINPNTYVLGLREATLLRLEDNSLRPIGSRPARLFKKGETKELSSYDNLSFLLGDASTISYC
jgi:hypothetical protein